MGTGAIGSPLAGKLFDETGNRLTPSHANKRGRRYRYYVSSRMVSGDSKAGSSSKPNGWRLPGAALEPQLGSAVRKHLNDHLANDLLVDPSVDEIGRIKALLDQQEKGEGSGSGDWKAILSFIGKVTIAPGEIEIELDPETVSKALGTVSTSINPDALRLALSFQFRKRGVEGKLVIGTGSNRPPDEILIRNIAKAHQYLDAVRQGQTFEEIAASEKLSKRRILQVIDLAFLAPDIVKSIIQCNQPIGLTAKWLGQHPLPSDWQAQRRIVATL